MTNETDFNSACEAISTYATLLTLRTRMLTRLGYAATASNPPPGMAALMDDYIRSAQIQLYAKNPSLRTERFYRWTLAVGIRYYVLTASDLSCTKQLDQYKVTWVGIQDLNNAWYPLIQGIPPEYYTAANTTTGLPSRYEIRSGVEIWPAPQAAYKLWIKGQFGLEPLVVDADRTTIDDELVFLLALGNAKKARGQPDADAVLAQAGNYLSDVKAGKHQTARYIPGTYQIPPEVRPTMTLFI